MTKETPPSNKMKNRDFIKFFKEKFKIKYLV